APEAIAMLGDLGVEAVRDYNRAFVLESTRRLRDLLGVEPIAPESMSGTMATVALPASYGTTNEDATRLKDALLFEAMVAVQLYPRSRRLWMPVSCQIYNDERDLERLVSALTARCPA